MHTSVITDSAESNVDFVEISSAPGQDVNLMQGRTCRSVRLTILSDLVDEENESFQLNLRENLANVYIVPGHESSVITIIDDDPGKYAIINKSGKVALMILHNRCGQSVTYIRYGPKTQHRNKIKENKKTKNN